MVVFETNWETLVENDILIDIDQYWLALGTDPIVKQTHFHLTVIQWACEWYIYTVHSTDVDILCRYKSRMILIGLTCSSGVKPSLHEEVNDFCQSLLLEKCLMFSCKMSHV